MKISDPIMKEFNFYDLVTVAQDHLYKIIRNSSSKEKLLFNLAGFYGGLVTILKEKYPLLKELKDPAPKDL